VIIILKLKNVTKKNKMVLIILVVPPNKQKSLFNKYCHALGEKIKDEKKKKNNRVRKYI
jgi:hypothetical protein